MSLLNWHPPANLPPTQFKNLSSRAGVSNLSLVAGQRPTLRSMAGRTNFPPAISFHLLFMLLIKFGILFILTPNFQSCKRKPKVRYAVLL